MMKYIISFLCIIFLYLGSAGTTFGSAVQTRIGDNIGSISNQQIPSNIRTEFNNTYSTNLPANITTMGEAYAGGYLSDGVEGPLSRYAAGLFDGGITGGGVGGCSYHESQDISSALDGCLSGTAVVQSGNFSVEGDFKNKINSWTRTIAGILALLAVGSIVLGSLMMTLSAGEDEKIKKGKDIVKWSIIGFIGVVVAGGLISLLVNFIFAIGS